MTTAAIYSHKNSGQLLKTVSCSILVIFFLFFIDEGAYNFEWMKAPGNWVAFFIYFSGFTLGQYLTYSLILGRYQRKNKLTLTNVIGIPLGFCLILLFFVLTKVLPA